MQQIEINITIGILTKLLRYFMIKPNMKVLFQQADGKKLIISLIAINTPLNILWLIILRHLEFVTFPVKVMARALIQRCRVARAHARSVDDRMQGILWW